jgi:homoserine kinase
VSRVTSVVVRVPATSANLGPGFDALGLALGVYDEVEVTLTAAGLDVTVEGVGADELPRDERHLVVRAFRAAVEALGMPVSGVSFSCRNRIPQGRGLGSSAAAIVAGIVAAQTLCGRRDGEQALQLADQLEGHPDNVAACLLGGLTIAWREPARVRAVRLDTNVPVAVLVPPETASTSAVRRLLPAAVPHADAAANAGRAALLVAALANAADALFPATEDRLHQPYRAPAMPATAALVRALRAAGVAAVVSGAGPSVVALGVGTDAVTALAPPGWAVLTPGVDAAGATVS